MESLITQGSGRRTKIVATIGPACDPPGVLESMIQAGLDVARINFSHGEPQEHLERIARVREAAKTVGRVVAIIADLPGPKLRCTIEEPRDLKEGEEISLAISPDVECDLPSTMPHALGDVHPGEPILLDDGRIKLIAGKQRNRCLYAKVEVGGRLLPHKGINLPDTKLSIPPLTPRDLAALDVAAEAKVEWVALSFVRDADAADVLRWEIKVRDHDAAIIAKIERPEAVRNIKQIAEAFDGIMVARGDMGVELPLAEVPRFQKEIIAASVLMGKPVITATEMLESMRDAPRPTRAEAADVANAIWDGTDAVMLSAETAVGKYPVETVRTMATIAEVTDGHFRERRAHKIEVTQGMVIESICHSATMLAEDIEAKAILAPTSEGHTPRLIARYRPPQWIIATSSNPATVHRMALYWGVVPFLTKPSVEGEDRLKAAEAEIYEAALLNKEDRLVMVTEHPILGWEAAPTIRVTGLDPDEVT